MWPVIVKCEYCFLPFTELTDVIKVFSSGFWRWFCQRKYKLVVNRLGEKGENITYPAGIVWVNKGVMDFFTEHDLFCLDACPIIQARNLKKLTLLIWGRILGLLVLFVPTVCLDGYSTLNWNKQAANTARWLSLDCGFGVPDRLHQPTHSV